MMVRFTADVFVRQIQTEIVELDIRKRVTSSIDVVSLINFQELFSDFNRQILDAYELYTEFWTQVSST